MREGERERARIFQDEIERRFVIIALISLYLILRAECMRVTPRRNKVLCDKNCVLSSKI